MALRVTSPHGNRQCKHWDAKQTHTVHQTKVSVYLQIHITGRFRKIYRLPLTELTEFTVCHFRSLKLKNQAVKIILVSEYWIEQTAKRRHLLLLYQNVAQLCIVHFKKTTQYATWFLCARPLQWGSENQPTFGTGLYTISISKSKFSTQGLDFLALFRLLPLASLLVGHDGLNAIVMGGFE